MLIHLGEGAHVAVVPLSAFAGHTLDLDYVVDGQMAAKIEDRIAVDDGGRGLQGLGLIQAACYKLIHT